MLRKELRDTGRTLWESSVVLALLPITYAGELIGRWGFDPEDTLAVVYPLFVGLFAITSGVSRFRLEQRNDAFEYLLSWPLGMGQRLVYKLLPRLGVLLALIGIGLALSLFQPLGPNLLKMGGLFGIALFMSLAMETLFVGVLGVFCIWLMPVLVGELLHARYDLSPLMALLLSFLFLLLPMALSFGLTFARLEAKPLKRQSRYYLMFTLPALLGGVVGTVSLFVLAR